MSIPRRRRSFMPWLLALAASFTLFASSVAQAQTMKPVAVVTLNSLDNLFLDANFLGGLAGQPEIAAQYQPMLKGFTPGLDHTKPLGLLVQSDGASISGALCVPVTDLKPLLAFLQNFGVTHEDGPGGTIQIGAQGQTLFAKEAGGWAFISMMPQMLENVPADPSKIFGELTKEYDLGVRLHVQNIPEAYKQLALGQLQMGMEAGMNKLETETDEQYGARKALTKVQVDQIKQAVDDLDALTLGFSIDSEQQRTFLDIVYTAVAGSDLAAKIAINSDPKTDFAGFYQPDAAMMMTVSSKVAESDVAQMDQMFDAISKQINAAIEKEIDADDQGNSQLAKSAVNDFLQSVKATMQDGKLDGGAVVNVSPSSLTFVAGGLNSDPAKVESGIKKLVEIAKSEEEDLPEVHWNSTSHGDVQFHTLNIPIPASGDKNEENARRLFGDTLDVAVGIGGKSVYFAAGRDCLEAVKEIIDTSAASPNKSVPPMEMTLALGQIMEAAATFVDDDERQKYEMVANMLTNEANGRDHIRMVVQTIPNGARTRIEAEEGVLRAAGMAAMAAQMEAAGAGAGGF